MRKKSAFFLMMLLAVTVLFSGCGCGSRITFEPESSRIYVKKDGSVVSADIETFTGSNYNADELTAYVEQAVSSYNEEHGSQALAYQDDADKNTTLPVAVQSLNVENEIATLFLDYASCGDYLEFNGTAGMTGGISTLQKSTVAELAPEGSFQNADGEDTALEDVLENEKYHVVEIEGGVTMQVEGTVRYVTTGVTVDDEHTVTTPDSGICYIVFR